MASMHRQPSGGLTSAQAYQLRAASGEIFRTRRSEHFATSIHLVDLEDEGDMRFD